MAENATKTIVFDYGAIEASVKQIRKIAESYKTEAATFLKNMGTATANWNGESKDAMIGFINGSVNNYIGQTVPELVTALADLLEQNAKQMAEADAAVGQSIQSSATAQN